MFQFKESFKQQWYLSKKDYIIEGNICNINQIGVTCINFLYQNYKNEFKGSIINIENDFNIPFDVAKFLQIIHKFHSESDKKFLALVVAPEFRIQKWEQNVREILGIDTKTINLKTCLKNLDEENGLILLLPFDQIKLAESLSEYNYSVIVIDHFDLIAKKLIIKNLCGDFNIGITTRNFYIDPDQILQWRMLNWAQPDCVGRLIDFYENDNDNFANLRDNYHHWWLTLTSDYCETFKSQFDELKKKSKCNQSIKPKKIIKRKSNKRKIENKDSENETKQLKSEDNELIIKNLSTESENRRKIDNKDSVTVKDDENEIKHSKSEDNGLIIKDLSTERDNKRKIDNKDSVTIKDNENEIKHSKSEDNGLIIKDLSIESINNSVCNEPTCSKTITNLKTECNDFINENIDEEKVLLDIIDGVFENKSNYDDYQSQFKLKKQELYTQIFNSNMETEEEKEENQFDDSEDFLISIINR